MHGRLGVELTRVSKLYRLGDGTTLRAVNDVDLTILGGDTVGLTGPSGSGKSTLLHLMGAMDVPDTGSIRIGDVELTQLRRHAQADFRATVGFVFQRFHLVPTATVVENVLLPLVGRRFASDSSKRARELLEAVGLAGRVDALPARLSGGQQQRVAIARALIARPVLVLADEPTGNLDVATATEVLDLLFRLQREHGFTMVVATHDASVVQRCRRLVTVADGRVTEQLRGDEYMPNTASARARP